MNNQKWFYFHSNLMGYTLYRNKKIIPKFAAFWAGFTADKILGNNASIKAVKI